MGFLGAIDDAQQYKTAMMVWTAANCRTHHAPTGKAVLPTTRRSRSYEERAMSASGDAGEAVAYAFLELARHGESQRRYSVGLDANIVTASIKAIVGGVNCLEAVSGMRIAA